MYVSKYVCNVGMCVCIHIHVYIYICKRACMYVRMHTYMYVCSRVHLHIYIYVQISVCIHAIESVIARAHVRREKASVRMLSAKCVVETASHSFQQKPVGAGHERRAPDLRVACSVALQYKLRVLECKFVKSWCSGQRMTGLSLFKAQPW